MHVRVTISMQTLINDTSQLTHFYAYVEYQKQKQKKKKKTKNS